MAWLGGSGETVKRLDRSNGSDKTAVVSAEAERTGLGGNGGDGGEEMTATLVAQAFLMIRRQQQQYNSDCGNNGGGANLAWLGSSGKTDRRIDGRKISDDTAVI